MGMLKGLGRGWVLVQAGRCWEQQEKGPLGRGRQGLSWEQRVPPSQGLLSHRSPRHRPAVKSRDTEAGGREAAGGFNSLGVEALNSVQMAGGWGWGLRQPEICREQMLMFQLRAGRVFVLLGGS